MKIKIIADGQLPGAFLIEAWTPEETLILRAFCADNRHIHIANFGGNSENSQFSMLIQHQDGDYGKDKPLFFVHGTGDKMKFTPLSKQDDFGISVCECSLGGIAPALEEFTSQRGSKLVFYYCTNCGNFIPNDRAKEKEKILKGAAATPNVAGEDIKSGSYVMLYSDGKYYGFPPRPRD